MCGRFALTMELAELMEAFPWIDFGSGYKPRFNIAPSQEVMAVPNTPLKKAGWFRWGLIPSWAKDAKIGNKMINARGETIAEKPSFRGAFRKKRCLIPSDGFYEWKKEGDGKTPYFIHLKSREPFLFAGLWELWQSGEESIYSCTIVTTDANDALKPIHHRMPVILTPDAYEMWLDPAFNHEQKLRDLLLPCPSEQITAYPVSSFVNSPRNEGPENLVPKVS